MYYGVHGNDDGVSAILDQSFENMDPAQDKVREWKEKHNYAPLDLYNSALLAYISITATKPTPIDPDLAGLSLTLLVDYYHERNDNLAKVYSRTYNSIENIHNYRILRNNMHRLPFDIFD